MCVKHGSSILEVVEKVQDHDCLSQMYCNSTWCSCTVCAIETHLSFPKRFNFLILQCDMLQACAICNLFCDTLHLKLQHEQSVKW